MDQLKAMMDPTRSLASIRRTVKTGLVNGRASCVSDSDGSSSEPDDELFDQMSYVEEYKTREEKLYSTRKAETEAGGSLHEVDTFADLLPPASSTSTHTTPKPIHSHDTYAKYPFDSCMRTTKLAIDAYKDKILQYLESSGVFIVQGHTGCGKTTQLPQYILDQARAKNKPCNIAVTQPRKIAAISVAKRVCEERGWGLGTVCGYQVGLKREIGPDTILTYMTSGVLLQKLIMAGNMHEYSHVVLDEVHERNQDMDFLLLLVRKFMNMNSPNVKVILMSATFDTEKFCQYFRTHTNTVKLTAPIIYISKERMFNTQIYYANQLSGYELPTFDIAAPRLDHCGYSALVKLVIVFNKLDTVDESSGIARIGNVLVFLPGIVEIETSYKYLKEESAKNPAYKWELIPLHSSITSDQQRKVFLPPKAGYRKIILSTNLAESSITVSDIEYVIDFCLTKTMVVDPNTHYQSLKLEWASRVNCNQRAGRVGRVSDGRVYRFVPLYFYENEMAKEIAPEILRAPLDNLVLSSKRLNLVDPPKAILALAIDPPMLQNIESTILHLKEVGALLLTCRGEEIISDGDLTFLGEVMATLPLDTKLSKMIVLGYIFSCFEECIIMAAGCSLSNVFATPFQERLKAYCNILPWADGSCSDLVAHLNLYDVWQKNRRSHRFNTNKAELEWAKKNFLSLRSLREWEILVEEITHRLADMGIKMKGGPSKVNLNYNKMLFFKIVFCGAFYPNYFIRSSEAGQVDEANAVRILDGHDPFKTVYFTNMDMALPGPLYSKAVKEILSDCSANMEVFFDCGKVFVKFVESPQANKVILSGQSFISSMSEKINTDVYKAVRKRQLNMRTSVMVTSPSESWRIAEQQGYTRDIKQQRKNFALPKSCEGNVLPTLDVQFMSIRVSFMIDAGHFWAHNAITLDNMTAIIQLLNTEKLQRISPPTKGDDIIGKNFVTKDNKNMYARCNVRALIPGENGGSLQAEILYIDNGYKRIIPASDLYDLPGHPVAQWPPQAIECALVGVQPSVVMNPRAMWSEEAKHAFEKSMKNRTLHARIYSIVNNCVYLELYKSEVESQSFNEFLIKKGYAEVAEESYLSKAGHARREQVQSYSTSDPHTLMMEMDKDNLSPIELQLPVSVICEREVMLRGPYSPLEMQVYSVVESGKGKTVRIDGMSVNSVLLDANPQDPHAQLVVAAYVGQSAESKSLNLRHTTVMPNIKGFPMLMSLLFCKQMEPKPVASGSHFAEILCGLGTGSSNSHRSLYPAHDLLVTLDTELVKDDINEINKMRYLINRSLSIMEDVHKKVNTSQGDIDICQLEIKNGMQALLRKQRKTLDRTHLTTANKWGKFLYTGSLLKPPEEFNTQAAIWPLHWTMNLKSENERFAEYDKYIEELSDLAQRVKPMTKHTCKFCDVLLHTVAELRIHLVSTTHITNVDEALANN